MNSGICFLKDFTHLFLIETDEYELKPLLHWTLCADEVGFNHGRVIAADRLRSLDIPRRHSAIPQLVGN